MEVCEIESSLKFFVVVCLYDRFNKNLKINVAGRWLFGVLYE